MIKKIQNGHKVNLFWVTISYGYLQTHPISLIIAPYALQISFLTICIGDLI